MDALQAAQEQRHPLSIGDVMLAPGIFLWEQRVQPVLTAPRRSGGSGVSQPTAGQGSSNPALQVGTTQPVADLVLSAWEREAQALRAHWHAQGFEHHGARAWTEVPVSPPSLRGLSRGDRVVEMVELGFLWASKKRGLSPLSPADRARIAENLFVDVSQNPHRKP